MTYRSGRHFDILNENIVFPLHAATTAAAYRSIFDNRRTAYGQALVLLNSSSHDEDHYNDPWEALIRCAVNSTIDGVPLIFPVQELGLSGTVIPPNDTSGGITPFGYDRYETNLGKPIPHFKKYNSLMPLWLKTQAGHASYNYGLAQLAPVFSGIGQARKNSPALRSSNRYYLNLNNATVHGQMFSVAKFEARNGAPNFSDVVFAFVNIARNADPETTGGMQFNLNADVDANGANDFGIKPARTYNVKNIAAYLGVDGTRRDTFLIPGGKTGAQLLSEGLYVKMNRVPTSDPAWASAPYEALYLKLFEPAPVWWTPRGAVGGMNDHEQNQAREERECDGGGGDQDGDGQRNDSEDIAATDPLDPASHFKIVQTTRLSASSVRVTWSSVPGRQYEVLAAGDLAQLFLNISGASPIPSGGATTEYTDNSATGGARFYKVRVVP